MAYYKNHGYQINGGCGPAGCGRINYAPVFVNPQLSWAVPHQTLQGPMQNCGFQVPPSEGYAGGAVPPGSAAGQMPPPGSAGGQMPPPGYAGGQMPPPGYAGGQMPPPGYAGGQMAPPPMGQVPPQMMQPNMAAQQGGRPY